MSERMLAAIKALSKGQRATIPSMEFGQFSDFMEAIWREKIDNTNPTGQHQEKTA